MWAALKTTSNSPPSRRAAFSAISAASSSRDSSNKNWPGGGGERTATVLENAEGSPRRRWGILGPEVLPLAQVDRQPGSYAETVDRIPAYHHSFGLLSDPFVPISRPWLIYFSKMKILPRRSFVLYYGCCLLLPWTSADPHNEMGLWMADKAVNRGWTPCKGPGLERNEYLVDFG